MAIGLRILIEKQQILFGSEITAWNLHVSPVIRGLEFYAGLALYPISLWFKDLLNSKHTRIISSLFEIIITLLTLALVVIKEGHWMRAVNRPLNVRPKTLTLRRSVFLWQNIALHLN